MTVASKIQLATVLGTLLLLESSVSGKFTDSTSLVHPLGGRALVGPKA